MKLIWILRVFIWALVLCGVNAFALNITSFSPGYGSPGATVIIYGYGFVYNATTVKFNNTLATASVTSTQGLNQITAYVPTGASTGPISVKVGTTTAYSLSDFIVVGPGPFITGFSPTNGASGTPVRITGVHFTGVNSVKFNGAIANFNPPTSDDILNAFAPNGVTTGPITVSSPQGSWTTSSNFYGAPLITSFTPATGRAGTNVTIVGRNFLEASALTFNGVPAENLTIVNNTQVTARVAAGTATGVISITTPGGRDITTSNFVILPNITGFSPHFGSAGTNVTITGTYLNVGGNPVVKFNGTPAVVKSSSPTQLVVAAPANTATGFITVQTSDGTATSAEKFYFPPRITSFSPLLGTPDTKVTVNGANFTDATNVLFNGASAGTPVVINNNQLTIDAPHDGTTGPITISTPGGDVVSGAYFFFPPAITNFSPVTALTGQVVTIQGYSLDYATSVQFGTGATTNFVWTNSYIEAVVPSTATSGRIRVTAPGGTAISSNDFLLDQVRLAIQRENDSIKLSWTTNAVGYVLQIATNLPQTSWLSQTAAPVIVNGKLTVTNRLSSTNTIFRLKK